MAAIVLVCLYGFMVKTRRSKILNYRYVSCTSNNLISNSITIIIIIIMENEWFCSSLLSDHDLRGAALSREHNNTVCMYLYIRGRRSDAEYVIDSIYCQPGQSNRRSPKNVPTLGAIENLNFHRNINYKISRKHYEKKFEQGGGRWLP